MNWNCEIVEARLGDYLDGLLEPADLRGFNAHVTACERCKPLVAQVSLVLNEVHSLEQIEPPPRLVYNILNQTLGPREAKKGWRVVFSWLRALASPRFAYSAVALVGTVIVLIATSGHKTKVEDFYPTNLYRTADRQAHLVYARSTKFFSDLRVVYEIQSRLNKDNELPTAPESTVPEPNPGKNPGSTDTTKPSSPRQQNRANGIGRQIEILAAEVPVVSGELCGHLLGRRIR
jgi:anti-sigma factor RsiW